MKIGISAIWFDDPTDVQLGEQVAQVRRTIHLKDDPLLQHFAPDHECVVSDEGLALCQPEI